MNAGTRTPPPSNRTFSPSPLSAPLKGKNSKPLLPQGLKFRGAFILEKSANLCLCLIYSVYPLHINSSLIRSKLSLDKKEEKHPTGRKVKRTKNCQNKLSSCQAVKLSPPPLIMCIVQCTMHIYNVQFSAVIRNFLLNILRTLW